MNYTVLYKNPFVSKSSNGLCYNVGLKRQDGQIFKVYLDPENRNYSRWADITNKGYVIDNLTPLKRDLINADSYPVLVSKPEQKEVTRCIETQTNLFA